MTAIYPNLLAWAAALIVPIVLYLVHHRPQRHRVSTLLFFKTLAREHQEAPWLRRLKRLLSLLLTLLVLAASVGAMAQLIIAPSGEDERQIVVLIDRSASMAAIDGGETTRLDTAIDAIEDRLAAIPRSVPISIVVYDDRPEVLLARSLDRREVARTFRSIQPTPIEGVEASALRLARRIAAIETPSAVWHVTDIAEPIDDDAAPAEDNARAEPAADNDIRVHRWSVAADRPVNVGISGFALRRMPMQRDRFEAFIQVHASGPEPVDADMEVRLDGRVAALRKVRIEPGEPQRMLIPVSAGENATIQIDVLNVDDDALPLDDRVVARVPPLKPIRVLWITPQADPFTELALAALGEDRQINIFQGGPDAYPPDEPVDVVLFQGWMPDKLPADTPVVAINPPTSVGPIAIRKLDGDGLPLQRLRVTDPEHPLLLGVASGRIEPVQTAIIGVDAMRSGIDPIWIGDAGPVLAAGTSEGRRIVVLAIDPSRSPSLPLLPSFPLLVGNAIYWSTESDDPAGAGPNFRTGHLLEVDDTELRWPNKNANQAKATPVIGRWVRLDRTGLFETDSGVVGSAALLSPDETVLPSSGTVGSVGAASVEGAWLAGDLSLPLLWVLAIVLVVESYLFHLKTVY